MTANEGLTWLRTFRAFHMARARLWQTIMEPRPGEPLDDVFTNLAQYWRPVEVQAKFCAALAETGCAEDSARQLIAADRVLLLDAACDAAGFSPVMRKRFEAFETEHAEIDPLFWPWIYACFLRGASRLRNS